MSTSRRTSLAAVAAAAALGIGGCGDKLPQSEAAKKAGEQPRQLLNQVESDVNKALHKGIERRQQAEKKE